MPPSTALPDKMRVYDIAKCTGQTSKAVMQALRAAGVDVARHTSTVDPHTAANALGIPLTQLQPATPESTAADNATPRKKARKKRIHPGARPGATVIKKYGNRRLYSTAESRYLTLDEIETQIKSGAEVHVVDASSGEDITAQILTQILLEGGQAKRLPVRFLEHLIRLGDEALQSFVGRFLVSGLDVFLSTQREMGRRYTASLSQLGVWPFAGMPGSPGAPAQPPYPQPGMPGWPDPSLYHAQAPLPHAPGVVPHAAGHHAAAAPNIATAPATVETSADEMAQLRARLEQLEARLGPSE